MNAFNKGEIAEIPEYRLALVKKAMKAFQEVAGATGSVDSKESVLAIVDYLRGATEGKYDKTEVYKPRLEKKAEKGFHVEAAEELRIDLYNVLLKEGRMRATTIEEAKKIAANVLRP